jgi:hypothetical protein
MAAAEKRRLMVDWEDEWADVWRRDDPRNYVYDVYFDHESTELIWLDNPNSTLTPIDNDPFDNKSEIVLSNPERYERIEPLRHTSHDEIFREWLATWPDDVVSKCDTGSLGLFLDDLAQHLPGRAGDARGEWNRFHERRLRELAEEWLAERKFSVEWTRQSGES